MFPSCFLVFVGLFGLGFFFSFSFFVASWIELLLYLLNMTCLFLKSLLCLCTVLFCLVIFLLSKEASALYSAVVVDPYCQRTVSFWGKAGLGMEGWLIYFITGLGNWSCLGQRSSEIEKLVCVA